VSNTNYIPYRTLCCFVLQVFFFINANTSTSLTFVISFVSVSMMMHLVLLVISFHYAVVGEIMPSCRLTFGSNKYDLTRLSGITLNGDGTTSDRYHYALNPCGILPPTSCGTPVPPRDGVMACQTSSTNTFVSVLAYIDGTKPTNAVFTEREEPGSGVVMTVRNGDDCRGPRPMIVTFICDQKVKHPSSIDVDESPACTFNIKLTAADACPLGPSDGSTSAPIDGGTIFVIVVLVIVTVYVVGGLSWKRFKQGHRGLETIPNRSFWTTVLTDIVTGLRFSLSKLRCSSNSKYQSV
jgi:hypothetical protein